MKFNHVNGVQGTSPLPAGGIFVDRRGAAALEFALIAPLFLMLVCGTMELSRWAWGAAAVRDAAARGARCIAVTPGLCGSEAAVQRILDGAGGVGFAKSACGVRVMVAGGHPAVLTPGLGMVRGAACAG